MVMAVDAFLGKSEHSETVTRGLLGLHSSSARTGWPSAADASAASDSAAAQLPLSGRYMGLGTRLAEA